MRDVFVFGKHAPNAPSKKPRVDKDTANSFHSILGEMMNGLYDVESIILDKIDLEELYKMRTNPQANEAVDEAVAKKLEESWPSKITTVLRQKFDIEDEINIVNLFSIKMKDDAFVFSHRSGFFNFRNVGGEFTTGEPEWLQLQSLPETIMQTAIDHFGVIEIIDSAYPGGTQIADKHELEKLPIRLHKFLISTEHKYFQNCSYYAKFNFEHVNHSLDAWKQMNDLMQERFTDEMREKYKSISSNLYNAAEEKYTFQDLSDVKSKLKFD
jgi:hypothetical protein